MFTSGELERASMAVDEPMKELESRIMTDIVRRIRENGEITAAADWQINRLVQLGMGMSEIKSAIEEALGSAENITDDLFEKVIGAGYVRDKKLYEAVGKVQIPFQENEPLQQLISSVTAQTNETMRNITQSLGFAQRGSDGRMSFTPIADYYQKTLDKAMLDISSGVFDYNTVLKRTVKDMTNSGLRTIDYATGWSNRVDVAARRAVMTGMTQLTAKVNEDNAEALETDWFEISWHSGARPSHWWGGKWYTKEQLTTICKLGDVQGLCGANCYHNYSPVIPGISEPTYTAEELEELNRQENEPVEWKGKQYTKYEALQRQRRLETTMRAQRQEMALLKEGEADEDDLINCRARYRVTSAEYTRFSEAMGLPQQRERVSADGLGNIMQGKYTGGSGKESPVRVPPIGAKVTDKVTAEERKELLSRDKVDIADNAKTTKPVGKASAVELWETENYKNSTEKGLLILPDGTTKDFGGIEHHVTGKEEDIKLMDGATFTHNHPTDNTFSQNDIVTGLVKGNLKEMRAVTSTGDVHILVNNGATEQQRKKFNADYQQRRMKAANTADAKIRRGEKINKDEYVKSRLETFMAEHAEEYNLSYSKTRIDVNKQSIDKSAKNGIIEVGKNYGKYRGQLDVPYEGMISSKDLDEFNKNALNSIMEETGFSEKEAREAQSAIVEWCGDDYKSFTNGQQKDKEKIINNCLSRMGAYDGEIQRGLSFSDPNDGAEFINAEVGKTVSMKSVSAWSNDSGVASRYAGKSGSDCDSVVLVCDDNKSAVGVQHISKWGTFEAEVLSPSTAEWEVTEKTVISKYDYLKNEVLPNTKIPPKKKMLEKRLKDEENILKTRTITILRVKEV